MIFKKLHLGSCNFNSESLDEVKTQLLEHYQPQSNSLRRCLYLNNYFFINFNFFFKSCYY